MNILGDKWNNPQNWADQQQLKNSPPVSLPQYIQLKAVCSQSSEKVLISIIYTTCNSVAFISISVYSIVSKAKAEFCLLDYCIGHPIVDMPHKYYCAWHMSRHDFT